MIKKGQGFWLILLAVLLQFGFVWFFDPSSQNGKQLLFAAGVLILACRFLLRSRTLLIPRILPLVGALLLLLSLSALQAFSPYTAFLALGVLAVGVACMLLAVQFFSTRPALGQTFVDLLLFAGVVAAAVGLYQYADFLMFRSSVHPFVAGLVPPTWDSRVSGIYGQPNMFALFLALCLLAFSYRYLHTKLSFGKIPSGLRFLPVIMIGVVFFATQSRNGLVALTVSLGILAIYYFRGQHGNQRMQREFLLLVASLVAAYIGFWVMGNLAGASEILVAPGARTNSDDSRLLLWLSSLLMFLEHPFLGVGLDNYKLLLSGFEPLAHKLLGFVEYEAIIYTKWAHNDLLQMLCEGGIAVFLILISLAALFFRNIWRILRLRQPSSNPFFFYSHLFLLPFMLQSLFSWPFRFPVIMFLFWVFFGMLLAQYPLRSVALPPARKVLWGGLSLVALLVTGQLLFVEARIGELYRNSQRASLEQNWADFESLMHNPYSEFRLRFKMLPHYINRAFAADGPELAQRVLPMAERAVEFQGAYAQMYGLAMVYQKLDRTEDSRQMLERAIALQPVDGAAWGLMHYLNVLEASKKSGRPLESFYEGGEGLEDLSSLELPNVGTEIRKY